MKLGDLDNLVFLLGTDWFLPYWSALGLKLEAEKKACIQQGCREIVKQILSGAVNYYHRGYTDERLAETDVRLRALLERCGADRSTVDKILEVTKGEDLRIVDERTAWLVLVITMQLRKNTLIDASPILDRRLKKAVIDVWDTLERSDLAGPDFEQACLHSRSDWDVFIRSTTPDQPTMLSLYLGSIKNEDKFERFWTAVNAKLSVTEKSNLINWYRSVGESMTGQPLRLPPEV